MTEQSQIQSDRALSGLEPQAVTAQTQSEQLGCCVLTQTGSQGILWWVGGGRGCVLGQGRRGAAGPAAP